MNRHELLRQADYTSQRGNRALARKYLSEILAAHPHDEAAWMLLARVEEKPEVRARCYERVLKLNPANHEAKLGLMRLTPASPTLPLRGFPPDNPRRIITPNRTLLRGAILTLASVLALVTTTYLVARSNPGSGIAQLVLPYTPTPLVGALDQDLAAQTRAQVGAQYPQYSQLLDVLIGLAIENAENGMQGAPERPGAEITPFDGAGREAREKFQAALPQVGALSSLTLDEEQVTSWLTLELKNNPDLPLSEIQVYLRDDKIRIWGMIESGTNSTSFLVTGAINVDLNGKPGAEIESVQIGQQLIPAFLAAQLESWLDQVMLQAIAKQAPGLEIMNINIGNGSITLSGMR